ncbi:ferrous iron transport protein A [Pseudoxanthobacter sp.]|uniref:FeoA family protein n=1 Tax=Pseudoxanthobacter sp. TaxID=1925742 RepID=UPI002FE2D509
MKRIPLYDVSHGTVCVAAVLAGPEDEARLRALGLHAGSRIEVVQHNGRGGLLVSVNDDARLLLDAATARSVLVARPEEAVATTTIATLKAGDRARIVGLGREAHGRAALEYRQRIMAMGLTPGVEFQMGRVAPLGDPVEIRVRGFSMSLRKAEAALLAVEKLPEEA